ncbi:hypothetical protein SCLCIDRAFT_94875, partial [Scleroderma citrinum Foug A]
CVTGLSSQLVVERFQRSPDTITRYFKLLMVFFSSSDFYPTQVHFPTAHTLISERITSDPHFKFFDKCIGAIDGLHIRAFTSTEDHLYMHNCK